MNKLGQSSEIFVSLFQEQRLLQNESLFDRFLAPPTLAGGFFTTAPPGKPAIQMFNKNRLFPIITMESHAEVLA